MAVAAEGKRDDWLGSRHDTAHVTARCIYTGVNRNHFEITSDSLQLVIFELHFYENNSVDADQFVWMQINCVGADQLIVLSRCCSGGLYETEVGVRHLD
jgi:hypothetical protein